MGDPAELHLFTGNQKGQIFITDLTNPPSSVEHYVTTEEKKQGLIQGHSKSVSCLDVSMSGSMLISGSLDETVKVWDIASHQCLRTLRHKGPVTNAMFMYVAVNVFSGDYPKPTLVVKQFKRFDQEGSEGSECIEMNIVNKTAEVWSQRKQAAPLSGESGVDVVEQLEEVKSANVKLYQKLLDNIMS